MAPAGVTAKVGVASAFFALLAGCAQVLGIDDFVDQTATSTATGGQAGHSSGGGGSDAGAGGTIAAGGSAGAPASVPPSCVARGPGAGHDCGAAQTEDCCTSLPVPGGTYQRSVPFCTDGQSGVYEATVSDFRLDKFEVTVGRFRAFIEAYDGSTLPEGTGAHERIPGSGWQSAWPQPSKVDMLTRLDCGSRATWTAEPGSNELLPMNCLSWYAAFLFCEWDGGRLPTEAEYNYAAAAGDQHRTYPWGNTGPDDTLAVWTCENCPMTSIQPVGSKPLGAGLWGQLDLAGNIEEWCFDASLIANQYWCTSYVRPCVDCAELGPSEARIHRGGSYRDWYTIRADVRREADALSWSHDRGVRCARAALP